MRELLQAAVKALAKENPDTIFDVPAVLVKHLGQRNADVLLDESLFTILSNLTLRTVIQMTEEVEKQGGTPDGQ